MFREYIALPAHSLIKLPESSHSFTEWAAILGTGSAIENAFDGNREDQRSSLKKLSDSWQIVMLSFLSIGLLR